MGEIKRRDELGPYDQGWNARLDGLTIHDNPITADEPYYQLAWLNGWHDARPVSTGATPMTPEQTAAADMPSTLRTANERRQREWHADGEISLAFRGNELAGEVGEACNVIKKLERERLGARGSRATKEQLADELADVVICADLTAMQMGINLDEAVREKFNATSEKYGLATRLAPPSSRPDHREAMMMARDAMNKSERFLKPLAASVFNDNGDLTVTNAPSLGYEGICDAYFIHRKVSAALAALDAALDKP